MKRQDREEQDAGVRIPEKKEQVPEVGASA
jgi:hypothetical protein